MANGATITRMSWHNVSKDAANAGPRAMPPRLGEHTDEVLADWLGLDAVAVASLREDGIV